MSLQEAWTEEIREIYARAELENLDLSARRTWVSGTTDRDEQEESPVGEVSRREVLSRQASRPLRARLP